jgi:hypothetical protein
MVKYDVRYHILAAANIKIKIFWDVTFQVLTAASIKIRVLWDVAPCSHVE